MRVAFLLLASCGTNVPAPTGSGDSAGAAVTYYRDVAPILAENCWGCHGENGIAFRSEGYQYAAATSRIIAERTADGSMPPWPPSDACMPLDHVRRLTDEERATLAEWDALGAPEGDPADAPAIAREDPSQAEVFVGMEEPYTPQAGVDDYRCFVLDPNLAADGWVTAMEVAPGNTRIVHHVILFTDPNDRSPGLDAAEDGPGYTCFGDPGFTDTTLLGGWVPGTSRVETPDGTGMPISAGQKIVMQVHYFPQNDPGGADQTVVGFDLADDPVTPLVSVPILDYNLNIPAGVAEHVEGASWTNSYPVGVNVYGITPHMHLLGSRISVSNTRAAGGEDCWIDIDDWDFQYQEFYWFESPVRFESGDTLNLSCTFDNSLQNPDNPSDPPIDVHWGERTTDEMCLAFVTFAL
jgi:mono/diheme cytochrome c family protein